MIIRRMEYSLCNIPSYLYRSRKTFPPKSRFTVSASWTLLVLTLMPSVMSITRLEASQRLSRPENRYKRQSPEGERGYASVSNGYIIIDNQNAALLQRDFAKVCHDNLCYLVDTIFAPSLPYWTLHWTSNFSQRRP